MNPRARVLQVAGPPLVGRSDRLFERPSIHWTPRFSARSCTPSVREHVLFPAADAAPARDVDPRGPALDLLLRAAFAA